MSNENNNSQRFDTGKPWAIYYKQAKNNLEDINNSLLKHLEILDKENVNNKFKI